MVVSRWKIRSRNRPLRHLAAVELRLDRVPVLEVYEPVLIEDVTHDVICVATGGHKPTINRNVDRIRRNDKLILGIPGGHQG